MTAMLPRDYRAVRKRLKKLARKRDPAALLAVERLRLEQACDEAYTDDEDELTWGEILVKEKAWGAVVDRTSKKIGRLDEAIANIIAPTPAGIEAQLWVARQLADGVYGDVVDHSCDCADRLVASIAAAVRKLALNRSPAPRRRIEPV
jgi:hypothetical protein